MVNRPVAGPGIGRGHLRVRYHRADGGYRRWGLYVWGDVEESERREWPGGLPFAHDDDDGGGGGLVDVQVRPGAQAVGFLVVDAEGVKDVSSDRFVEAPEGAEIWLRQDDPQVYQSRPGGGAASIDGARAHWIDRDTVAWPTSPASNTRLALVCAPYGGLRVGCGVLRGVDDRCWEIPLRPRPGGLTAEQRRRFPHLAEHPAFAVEPASGGPAGGNGPAVADALRCQLVAVERDRDGVIRSATGVQIPGVVDDRYAAAVTARLGPTFEQGTPAVALWAPTAHSVELELVASPGDSAAVVAMTLDPVTGVWSAAGDASWTGRYYRFRVTGYQPATGAVETAAVTDPYSVSLSTGSQYSQLVDLDDPSLAPQGWHSLRAPSPVGRRPQVHELSVRDFSIADESVPARYRGTYLAFTVTTSRGMTRLRDLAAAGLTHVQLLPVSDFAGVPDRRADQRQPAGDLASLPPDSDLQQAGVDEVADTDGYDWGYAPLHFTAPEGSYATDPAGAARIRELRQAVAALARAGLGTVLDIAYNHTAAAGGQVQGGAGHCALDAIVPGYYHRLLADGTVAASTGGAETAPEHAMMGKLVVDSVATWARQYRVAGFRFDYMGHHPKANLLAVRAALDALTPERDGVDGRAVLLWGEGWNAGVVADGARFVQATQANLAGTGIGTFNDRLRDAVRGGGPMDRNPRAQGFASGLYTDPNGDPVNGSREQQRAELLHLQDLIQVGLTGNLAGYRFTDSGGRPVTGAQVLYHGSPAGYTAAPGESLTYVDAHDNEILYDALAFKLPPATALADRVRAQLLALAFTVFSQGIGFVVAGSDRLRSKSLDANSYRSGDWFNAILGPETGNGFGRGLPPRRDNGDRWDLARRLLADPALVPDAASMLAAGERYAELLRVRSSSPLFCLPTAARVQRHLSFPLAGSQAPAGLIVMVLTGDGAGTAADDAVDAAADHAAGTAGVADLVAGSVVVAFNAWHRAMTQAVPGLAGHRLVPHPVLAAFVDPATRSASFDVASGECTVPGRGVAVFVARRPPPS